MSASQFDDEELQNAVTQGTYMVAQSEDVSSVYKELFTRQMQHYQELKCRVDELNNSKKYFFNVLSVTRDFNEHALKDMNDVYDSDEKVVEKMAGAKTKDYEETLVTAVSSSEEAVREVKLSCVKGCKYAQLMRQVGEKYASISVDKEDVRKNISEYDQMLKSLQEQERQYLAELSDMSSRWEAMCSPIPEVVNAKAVVNGIKANNKDIENKKSELANLKIFADNISAKITKDD